MSRLSDVLFAPSQENIELIKEVLKRAGLSDDQITSKKWSYFKWWVRRTYPPPKKLEADFNWLVNMMAHLKDAKSQKPLFGKKAWNLYKLTMQHVQKGCLSDHGDTLYYVQLGEDSLGIPMYKSPWYKCS